MKNFNQGKAKLQKGFTFVELLVIMVIIAIIGGIGIQFVLSTQEDKAKLTNARTFFAKDFPNAVMSCMVRKNEVTDCDLNTILAEDLDEFTEWGDKWGVVSPASMTTGDTSSIKNATMTKRVRSRSITLCYPLEEVSLEDRATIATDIIEYLDDETSWTAGGDNTDGQGYAISGAIAKGSDDKVGNGGVLACRADNQVGGKGDTLETQLQGSNSGTIASGNADKQVRVDNNGEDDANMIEVTYVVRRR